MKKKKERLAILAIVMVLVASVAITAYTTGEHRTGITPFVTDGTVHSWPSPVSKAVVWDNGMNYIGLGASQNDPASGLDPIEADDFMFTQDQLVNDVHWIGGYWVQGQDPYDGNFDWEVKFYNDIGDGTKPGAVIATYTFPNAQVNETLIESTYSYFCSYSVDLPAPLSFMAGMKYWISIQGIGAYPPQSGWGMHDDPILLHQAVFKSVYFGFPNWTNSEDVFGYAVDMCFQLTYEEECDWQPGDPHKMHFPQLPDEDGWDVNATQPLVLADDWQCSDSGWVKDIHFWGSWKYGLEGTIVGFWLSIHSNIPDPDGPGPLYSKPGVTLWELYVEDFDFTPIDPPTSEGWYDPSTGEVIPDDHQAYFQYNICLDEPDWFYQFQDTIYWLNISAVVADPTETQWGWKNSEDHFLDDAVWAFWGELNWIDIWEPSEPLMNLFWVAVDPGGMLIPPMSGGTNYYDDGTSINGWYFYEPTEWWNIWFYDHPFDSLRKKVVHTEFDVFELEPGPPSWLTFAVNWSTDLWSIDQPPADSAPPLPGVPEELYIGRDILYDGPVEPGHHVFDWEWPDYNPEWISIDVMGYNFVIPEGAGWIEHDCRGSLDLAFVITGGIECTPSIDVKKKVWDETLQEWVDSTDIDVCNNAEFLITIHNDGTCCDLTNIIVEDFMDSSLEFLDAVPPPDIVDPVPGGTYLEWNFPGPLSPCNTIDITVTAHVVGPACHLDSNYVWAQGDCEEQAVGVYDEDVAYVHATEEPWPNHKMHYPQLPDPEGWDVVATMAGIVVADDFMCTKTGPITDVHFWGSWLGDYVGEIAGFYLSIHADIPAPPFSHPGEELWSAYITDFEVVPMNPSPQGWYDPYEQWWEHPNHNEYFRYDITNIPEPFYQDSGTIYWLDIIADLGPPGYPELPLWGWKTSLDHWNDDAVWAVFMPPYQWIPLYDPITGITLDMAFVITGEEIVKCGDVNNDGVVDLGDIVYLLNYLYKQPAPAPVPYKCVGDVNNDDVVDLGDIVYLINYLYKQPAPPPNPNCCNPPWAAN